MKKKIITLLLVVASVFVLAGCSGGNGNATKSKISDVDTNEEQVKVEMEVLDQKVISKESGYWEAGFKIKNNSNKTMYDPKVRLNLIDKNGDIIGTTSASSTPKLEPGQSAFMDTLVDARLDVNALQVIEAIYCFGEGENQYEVRGFFKDTEPLQLETK